MDANAKVLKKMEEDTKATKAQFRELNKAIKDLIKERAKFDSGVDVELDHFFSKLRNLRTELAWRFIDL